MCGGQNAFSRLAELFSLMDLSHTGASRQQAERGLDQLKGVDLEFKNAWSDRSGKVHTVFRTGVLDSYYLSRRGDQSSGQELCWVQWSARIFEDMASGNMKELDIDVFFRLKSTTAQRMYCFLDRHLPGKPHFSMELRTFAQHVGLSESQQKDQRTTGSRHQRA